MLLKPESTRNHILHFFLVFYYWYRLDTRKLPPGEWSESTRRVFSNWQWTTEGSRLFHCFLFQKLFLFFLVVPKFYRFCISYGFSSFPGFPATGLIFRMRSEHSTLVTGIAIREPANVALVNHENSLVWILKERGFPM